MIEISKQLTVQVIINFSHKTFSTAYNNILDISDAVQIKDDIEKVSFEKSDLDEIFGEKEDNAVPLEAKATIEEDKVVPESMKPHRNAVDSRDEVNVEEFLAVQVGQGT